MYGGIRANDGGKGRKKAEAQEGESLTWDNLEKIAFGQMGMSVEDFYNMIPRHFFNKMDGFYELEQTKDRANWERTRWQTCYLLNIHLPRGKHIKLKDLVEFDWDKKTKKADYKKLKNKAEYIKKLEDHGK
jgi:hypothetical protein